MSRFYNLLEQVKEVDASLYENMRWAATWDIMPLREICDKLERRLEQR